MSQEDERDSTAIETIVHYASSLQFEDLPQIVVTRARQVVLDTLGTAIGGYQSRLGQLGADFAASMLPGSDASLIADGRKSTLEGAAWANAVMAKHLGMDDSHRECSHVAAELVPVALALAEQRHLSGRSVITALAAGYDVMGVIHPAVKVAQRRHGLDSKAQAGTLASTITAGLLLGLDRDRLGHALALAADMACGTEQYVYDAGQCDTKDLLAGYGARNGIHAARLAAFGFQGPPHALDGPYGYYQAFGDGFAPAYLNRLGQVFTLGTTAFKPHAGCRHVHACVDATQALLKRQRLDLDAIAAVEIGTYSAAATPAFRVNYHPETVGQAGFSLPVAVSVVLVRGSWFLEDIQAYAQPEIQHLMPLVRVYVDEQLEAAYPEKNGCVVTIKMLDGAVYRSRVEHAKGEPENMLSDEEFEQKFRRLVGNFVPAQRIERMLDILSRLEALDDVGELIHLSFASQEATVAAGVT